MKKTLLALLSVCTIASTSPAYGVDATEIEVLTLPFGTQSYSSDMAVESLFKEVKSPVQLMLKQTPGMMYIMRIQQDNRESMRNGDMPFSIYQTIDPAVTYAGQGLPPFEKFPL